MLKFMKAAGRAACMTGALAALAAFGTAAPIGAGTGWAQGAAGGGNSGGIAIPGDVAILGENNPNMRRATAVVNGAVVTGTDVDHRVALLVAASQGNISAEELKRVRLQVLRNLIDETLQIQAAAAQEIQVDKAQVDQRYAQVASQNFGTDTAKMDSYLLSIGSSPASLKRQIRGEIAWQNLLRRNVTPFINVAEEEVREEIERMERDRGTNEYRIAEIYLSAAAENREAVSQNAQQIVNQLRQGGSFVAYARQYSEATTASVGGDLGFIRLSQLPNEMSSVIGTMQIGQLVGPVEIPGGFTIIYLTDRRQVLMADPRDAVLSLKQIHIAFPPGSTEASARAKMEQFATAIESMQGCADAERASAAIGADVVANQLKARELPDQLQAPLLQLQVGQTTQPFGSMEEGVRVLMLCGRQDPASGGGLDFETVLANKEEERIGKRAQRYLRDLRNDAYIEYN